MLKLLKGQREREKEKGTACNQKYISRICISTRRKSKENTTDTKIKCDIHCCSTVQRKITQRTQFFHSRTLLLDKTVTTHDLSIVPFQWYFKEVWQKQFKFYIKVYSVHTHTIQHFFFPIRCFAKEAQCVNYALVKHHGIPKTTLL